MAHLVPKPEWLHIWMALLYTTHLSAVGNPAKIHLLYIVINNYILDKKYSSQKSDYLIKTALIK